MDSRPPKGRRLAPLNTGTQVPIPTAGPQNVESTRRRWPWLAAAVVLIVLAIGVIRGDAPATVIVAEGTVTPVEGMNPEAPSDSLPYERPDPTAGENLEVCEWDYCLVHREVGDPEDSGFVYVIDLREARLIADAVTTQWNVGPVSVSVESLPGDVAGLYDPNRAAIVLEEPIIAWTVLHELAHHLVFERYGADALSHGPEFLETLERLAG